MKSRRRWRLAIAVVAAGLAVAAVLFFRGRAVDWRGEAGGVDSGGAGAGAGAGGAGAGAGGHGGGLFAQNASHETPPGQPPVTDLKVDRLRDAFNQAAAEPRIIVSLSPT
jgi:hypothetical protein